MTAQQFLKLCETGWTEANCEALHALRHKDIRENTGLNRECIDNPKIGSRADAELAREVVDKLYEITDKKNVEIGITRLRPSYCEANNYPRFSLHSYYADGDVCITEQHDNLTWLYAAAVVQLATEGI